MPYERTNEEIAREIVNGWLPQPVTIVAATRLSKAIASAIAGARAEGEPPTARPLSEWHEDIGDVLWWKFPIKEPPYVGTPNDLGQTVEISVRSHGVDKLMRVNVGGWPGYHTHWTPIPLPAPPKDEGEG